MHDVLAFLQALATPAIAFAGATIAWQQKRLADIRLRNDLFERRFKIYEAARTYLLCATANQRFPGEAVIEYSRGTDEAAFFFSQAIVDYLQQIKKQTTDMRVHAVYIAEGRDSSIDKAYALQQWCADQITERKLFLKFKPEMELRAPSIWSSFKNLG